MLGMENGRTIITRNTPFGFFISLCFNISNDCYDTHYKRSIICTTMNRYPDDTKPVCSQCVTLKLAI